MTWMLTLIAVSAGLLSTACVTAILRPERLVPLSQIHRADRRR